MTISYTQLIKRDCHSTPIPKCKTSLATNRKQMLKFSCLRHGPAGNKEESIERLRYLKPSAPFRKRFQYCNSGYLVASTIPEQLLGLPFTQFVQEKVFEPLKLQDTTYDPAWAKSTGRRADGFIRSKTARHGLDLERTNIGWFTTSKITLAGQGGIISSACDMVSMGG